jgi:HTH-type transcriptional regulator/antitoxin HigA
MSRKSETNREREVNEMKIRPIRTHEDYEATLRKIEGLMDAAPDSPEGDRLDVLATLVEAYETRHFPIDANDPVEAVTFAMEQKGLSPADLVPYIGRTNRVYEVLNRKRKLSLRMIRNLHKGLGIPLEHLIR